MSFAILASGSKDVVARSIVASIAVFTISAIRTKEMATRSAISSSFVTPYEKARMRTAVATAK